MDEFISSVAGEAQPRSADFTTTAAQKPPNPTSQTAASLVSQRERPEPPPVLRSGRVHPLERRSLDQDDAEEAARIQLAWIKLTWLLAFLAVLLAVSYLVPFIAEQTQYALTRGKQRAEHDFASQHVGESPLGDLSRAYQMVSQIVGPSVVHISTHGDEAVIRPLSNRARIPTEGQGSGIVVEASGYILTNYHVVKEARQIDVSLADGRKERAEVIGYDKDNDLAVLRIQADKLVPATWGDSEQAEPGALVWAVGSPFGLERSITSGILSAKHRAGRSNSLHQDFLQTDAAVNPGNSGGPLVDNGGRVIGVNTAIVGDAFQGISFAIPSKVARDIYTRIKAEGGALKRGWLGVELATVTDDQARDLGLSSPTGVFIAGIFQQKEGSPAARAGISAGDVVLRWNNAIVHGPDELKRLVSMTAVGSRAQVAVLRDRQELSLEVVVGERPALD